MHLLFPRRKKSIHRTKSRVETNFQIQSQLEEMATQPSVAVQQAISTSTSQIPRPLSTPTGIPVPGQQPSGARKSRLEMLKGTTSVPVIGPTVTTQPFQSTQPLIMSITPKNQQEHHPTSTPPTSPLIGSNSVTNSLPSNNTNPSTNNNIESEIVTIPMTSGELLSIPLNIERHQYRSPSNTQSQLCFTGNNHIELVQNNVVSCDYARISAYLTIENEDAILSKIKNELHLFHPNIEPIIRQSLSSLGFLIHCATCGQEGFFSNVETCVSPNQYKSFIDMITGRIKQRIQEMSVPSHLGGVECKTCGYHVKKTASS